MGTLHIVIVAVAFVSSISSAQEYNVTCPTGQYPPNSTTRVNEKYVINLDLSSIDRWTELAKAKKDQVDSIIISLKKAKKDQLLSLMDGVKDVFKGTPIEQRINELEHIGAQLVALLPSPFADEIRGIAETSGLNLGDALLLNLLYEFSSDCTSIIAEDPKGNLLHARNLDFDWRSSSNKSGIVSERLRHLVVNLDWQRGGKTVFKSVNFAGYTGILTAVKPNLFTFTINTRHTDKGTILDAIKKWFEGPDRSKAWLRFLIRNVLENATSYNQAKDLLENTKMIAPAYFILGGNKSGEGVVITRNADSNNDTWPMRNATNWYIVQTNQDHWDTQYDLRRNFTNTCMTTMGQNNVGYPGLFNVLSIIPVLHPETIYTSLMRVNTGEIESYIRNISKPLGFPRHTSSGFY